METKPQTIPVQSPEDAMKMVKELTTEYAEAKAEATAAEVVPAIGDDYVGDTEFSLPKLTNRGMFLLASCTNLLPDIGEGMDQLFLSIWVLRNQKNTKAFRMSGAEIELALVDIAESLPIEQMEKITTVTFEAINAGTGGLLEDSPLEVKEPKAPATPRKRRGRGTK